MDTLPLEMRSAAKRGVGGIPEESLEQAKRVAVPISVAMVDRIYPFVLVLVLLLDNFLGVALELSQVRLLLEEGFVLGFIFKLNWVHELGLAEAGDSQGFILVATKSRPFHSTNQAL